MCKKISPVSLLAACYGLVLAGSGPLLVWGLNDVDRALGNNVPVHPTTVLILVVAYVLLATIALKLLVRTVGE